MTRSCIWVDFEKQIVLRTRRLIRMRSVRYLRSRALVQKVTFDTLSENWAL